MYITDAGKQYKNKYSSCKLLQRSYRDKDGKVKKQTILNLSKLPTAIADAIEKVVTNKKTNKTPTYLEDIKSESSKSLGEVEVLLKLAKNIGLFSVLKKELDKQFFPLVMAMVINRISSPTSKYSLTEWLETNYLPELLKTDLKNFHHNRLYEALEELDTKLEKIEQLLFKQTLTRENNLNLILYDITSSYVEGEQNELAAYGYNRDGKKGKKQIVIGLITTLQGRPVSIEVLTGNTADKTTLLSRIESLKTKFGLKQVIYTFDRGMKDEPKLLKLDQQHIKYLTALNKREIKKLCQDNQSIQPGLFDEKIAEVQVNNKRYVFCKSDQAARSHHHREELLQKTTEKLQLIQKGITKKLKDPQKIARVEKWVNRWNMGKYINISYTPTSFTFSLDQEKINQAQLLDKVYVLVTTASNKELTTQQVQHSYKNLNTIENNFRLLKSSLDIRPIYHRKKETVKAHIFICFLSLYLQKELEILTKNLCLEQKMTFSYLLTQLREIRQTQLITELDNNKFEVPILTQLTDIQHKILEVLKMRIKPLPTAIKLNEMSNCSK